jgi:hypothetical protein
VDPRYLKLQISKVHIPAAGAVVASGIFPNSVHLYEDSATQFSPFNKHQASDPEVLGDLIRLSRP